MKTIIRWVLLAVSILAAAYFVPGIHIDSFLTALLVAIVFSLVSLLIKPILLILTLPINILTLGLFTLVINGILFGLAAYLVGGVQVAGLIPAIIGALVVSVVNGLLHLIVRD